MKRYLVFAFLKYDADGGWNDFVGAFDDLAAAAAGAEKAVIDFDQAQVVDLETLAVVQTVYPRPLPEPINLRPPARQSEEA